MDKLYISYIFNNDSIKCKRERKTLFRNFDPNIKCEFRIGLSRCKVPELLV